MPKIDLLSLTLPELETILTTEGYPGYRARQTYSWVYGRGVTDFSSMINLPRALRAELAERMDAHCVTVNSVRTSTVDGTRKLSIGLRDGLAVESVLMFDGGKSTVCVSTQVGCALGCAFCATGRMGLARNLSAGEIVGQVMAAAALLDRTAAVSRVNVVFMGMGEPLANTANLFKALRILNEPDGLAIGARRMTVSTVGLPPGIHRLARLDLQVGLAISVNAADDDLRSQLMPVNKRHSLDKAIEAAADYASKTRRRVTLEYVLLGGVNDRKKDAAALADIAHRLPCKINIIEYNGFAGAGFRQATPGALARFVDYLYDRAPAVMVRHSKGADIGAACGQLFVGAGDETRRLGRQAGPGQRSRVRPRALRPRTRK
jgi:23S rRNA (adenine2503-C2)-methyltransferase